MAEQKFEINKLYTKDISVEAPNNPEIFQDAWEPSINLNIANANKKIDDESFEISLTLTVTATLGEKTAYIVEVTQSGIFSIIGYDQEHLGYLSGATAPNILFPYAREVVSTLSQKAGFPPMLLNPIDFNGLYQQHLQQQAESNKGTEAETNDSQTKH